MQNIGGKFFLTVLFLDGFCWLLNRNRFARGSGRLAKAF